MIITRLCGGLGNQLFQYAAGVALSKHLGVRLAIDNSYYKNQPPENTPRQFLLDHLSTEYYLASQREQYLAQKMFDGNRLDRKIARLLKYFLLSPYSFYCEPKPFTYDSNIFNNSGNTIIDGYWQTYRYLESIETILRKEIVVSQKYRYEQQDVLNICAQYHAVFVHVRRGDFVSNPYAASHHALTNLDYYKVAIEKCKREIEKPYFILFSEDAEWVEENIALLITPFKYILFKSQDSRGLDDFYHMSQCSHAIIANSSFSWWAAWLISNKNKFVIAPKKWLKNSSEQYSDLVPPSWVII